MTRPRRITTTDLTVNLRVEGTGPPLLFLGGSNFDLSIKAPVFDSRLPEYFTVAAADPRGLGLTDASDGDWTMIDYAQDALHVLDALDWDDAYILGESFGAMTALHLAKLAPTRIKGMALAAGTPGGLGGSSYAIETFRHIIDASDRARAALSIMDTRFSAVDPTGQAAKIKARILFETAFLTSHSNAAGYPRLLAARASHDCWAALPDMDIPTHVFAGEYDGQAPKQYAQAMADAMPDAIFHLIAAGHNLCFASDTLSDTLITSWSTTTKG